MSITFNEFKAEIEERIIKEHLHFSAKNNRYYAKYEPKRPEKTAADFLIVYDFVTEESSITGNLEALIPTIIKGTFDEILNLLDHSEAKKEKNIKLVDWAVDTLIKKYLAAGGSEKEMMSREQIGFFFDGILYREGEDGVRKFINEWKYNPTPKRRVGYC